MRAGIILTVPLLSWASGCESLGGLSEREGADAGDASVDGGAVDPGADASTDASADSAGATGIRCGSMRCAQGQVCCADRDAGTFGCTSSDACFATTFRCEDTEGCTALGFPAGTQCCGNWGGSTCGMKQTSCGTCAVENGMLCNPNVPLSCGDGGAKCVKHQCWPDYFYICQNP
jgi:hypothetical protein